MTAPTALPRPFVLRRFSDPTGISGTGVVAEGAVFSDGTVALRWTGQHPSTAAWGSLEDMLVIHGHGGQTIADFAHQESEPDDTDMTVEDFDRTLSGAKTVEVTVDLRRPAQTVRIPVGITADGVVVDQQVTPEVATYIERLRDALVISDELVEKAARGMWHSGPSATVLPWEIADESVRRNYRVWARAALQAGADDLPGEQIAAHITRLREAATGNRYSDRPVPFDRHAMPVAPSNDTDDDACALCGNDIPDDDPDVRIAIDGRERRVCAACDAKEDDR